MYVRDLNPLTKGCAACGGCGCRVVRHVLVHPEDTESAAFLFRCEKCGAFGAFATGKASDELEEVAEKFAGKRGDVEFDWEEVEIGS